MIFVTACKPNTEKHYYEVKRQTANYEAVEKACLLSTVTGLLVTGSTIM